MKLSLVNQAQEAKSCSTRSTELRAHTTSIIVIMVGIFSNITMFATHAPALPKFQTFDVLSAKLKTDPTEGTRSKRCYTVKLLFKIEVMIVMKCMLMIIITISITDLRPDTSRFFCLALAGCSARARSCQYNRLCSSSTTTLFRSAVITCTYPFHVRDSGVQ